MHSWITKYKIMIGVVCFALMNLASATSTKLPTLTNSSVLPVEQAFILNVFQKTDSVKAQWQIANGNYLYQDKLQLSLFDKEHKKLWSSQEKDLPTAIGVDDPYFGKQSIYRDTVTVSVTLDSYIVNTSNSALYLQADFQGCSESGFCYPPQIHWFEIEIEDHKIASVFPLQSNPLEKKSSVTIESDAALTELDAAKLLAVEPEIVESESGDVETETSKAIDKLNSSKIIYSIATFYFIGILLSFTPCVLPMIPILFGVIVGQKHLNTRKAFRISLTYVLSMAITYALAGIVVAKLGKNLQAHFQYPIVIILFAALFVILGLSQIGVVYIKLPRHFNMNEILTKLHAKQTSGTYIGAAIMGVLATLISSPCVTAPLIGALGYISQSGNIWLGGSALLAMGLGMGTILLILGTLGGKYMPKAGAWMHTVNRIFAIAMFGFSIWLLDRVFHGPWILVLSAALCFYIAWCLMTIHTHRKWYYGFGILFILYAFVLLWGAWLKEYNPFKPLLHNPWSTFTTTGGTTNFETIKSLTALEQLQKKTQSQGKPMIGVFTASWCSSCKQLKANVFSDSTTLEKLKAWEVVYLDVTKFNEDAQALSEKFGIVGPPVILFFDKNGEELPSYRIVGTVSAKVFNEQLNKVLQELEQ